MFLTIDCDCRSAQVLAINNNECQIESDHMQFYAGFVEKIVIFVLRKFDEQFPTEFFFMHLVVRKAYISPHREMEGDSKRSYEQFAH